MEQSQVDLQSKYQKLASEYSKMRAQIAVLKKAVVEEQSKLSDFKEIIKEKEQVNRKYEQEMESLSFRNQQLTKRIMVLQEEIDEIERRGKKGKNKLSEVGHNIPVCGNVISEELEQKIEENATLHKKLYDTERVNEAELQDLKSQIENLQRDASQHETILKSTQISNKAVINKLTKEKARIELRLQSEEKELKELRMAAEMFQDRITQMEGDLGGRLSHTTETLQNKLLFNDTRINELNSLNIPTVDTKQQKCVIQLVSQISDIFKEFVNALSNYHTYNEQRVIIFYEGQQLSPVNSKFVVHLHNNASQLRPLIEAFDTFQQSLSNNIIISMETLQGFHSFYERFCEYISYWNILLPYHLLSLQEECSLSSCSSSLETKNLELYDSLFGLSRVFNKVLTYLDFINYQSKHIKKNDYPESSQSHILHLLSSSICTLHSSFKDIWKHFNNKISLEHQLPTVSEKLKRTNECVLSSLISLVNCLGKISMTLENSLNDICKRVAYKSRGSSVSVPNRPDGIKTSPAVLRFQKRAANYISSLEWERPDSVPYEKALENREKLNSSTESHAGLAKQYETMQDKVHKLEQAKEHWMLEFQLLEIKHERDLKKLQQLEDRLENGVRSVEAGVTNKIDGNYRDQSKRSSSSAMPLCKFGLLEKTESNANENDAREDEIKRYFTARINELVSQMQMADSKAVTFQTECFSLQNKLYLADKTQQDLDDKLDEANSKISVLQEELQLTTKNYDAQLNTMSEHLANLNETLASQKDEIDALNYSLKHKGQKKGKGK